MAELECFTRLLIAVSDIRCMCECFLILSTEQRWSLGRILGYFHSSGVLSIWFLLLATFWSCLKRQQHKVKFLLFPKYFLDHIQFVSRGSLNNLTHSYIGTHKLLIFSFFFKYWSASQSPSPSFLVSLAIYIFHFLSLSLSHTASFHLSIQLYFIHPPPDRANFHSVWICETDGALRGMEAAFTSLERGWRGVSTSPLLHTN